MKIRILSDIHLEFGFMDFRPCGEDVLVLAGDVGVVKKPKYLDIVEEWASLVPNVIYVPGNHEYYKGDITASFATLQEWAPSNVYVMNNNFVVFDDVAFIGSTLWSDTAAHPMAQFHANSNMNDFRLIRRDNYARHFKAEDAKKEFDVSVGYIKSALAKLEAKKKVIVTHFAPTFQSIHPQYAGDLLNYAFASDLEYLMNVYEPDLWIHGHMHHSVDIQIGKTRVVCNPRGYVGYEINENFNKRLICVV